MNKAYKLSLWILQQDPDNESGLAPRAVRHTFICRRVLQWHLQGVTIDNAMVALSTYVGHAKVSDTYWYLTGVPELMAIAGRNFEQFASKSKEGGRG